MMLKQVHITYKSSQKTQHQKLSSYWVIDSLEDNSILTAEPADPVIEIKLEMILLIMYDFVNICLINDI